MKTLIFMPVVLQTSANQAADQLQLAADGTQGGLLTFTVPLFAAAAPDDSTPTFLWCSANILPALRTEVDSLLHNFPGAQVFDYDADSDPGFPQRKLTELNLRSARPSFPK